MPRLNVRVSETVFKLVQNIPKANRGQLVTASVEHFMNTADGKKIIGFLTSNTASLTLDGEDMLFDKAETATDMDDMGIDTSDWSV